MKKGVLMKSIAYSKQSIAEVVGNRYFYLLRKRGFITKNFKGSWMERSYDPGWGGSPIDLGVAPRQSRCLLCR